MTEELYEDIGKQLQETKEDFEFLNESCDKMAQNNPFIEDGCGVPTPRLMHIIEHSVLHIIKQIAPYYDPAEDEDDFIGYYIWEGDFGGLIEVDGIEYHLDKPSEFVAYVRKFL